MQRVSLNAFVWIRIYFWEHHSRLEMKSLKIPDSNEDNISNPKAETVPWLQVMYAENMWLAYSSVKNPYHMSYVS